MKIFIFVWLMFVSAALNAATVHYDLSIADINGNGKKEVVLFADQALTLRDGFGNKLTIPVGKQRLKFTKLLATYEGVPWSSLNGKHFHIEGATDFVQVGFGKRHPRYKFNLGYIDGVNVTPTLVPLPSSALLLLSGILGTALVGRRRTHEN